MVDQSISEPAYPRPGPVGLAAATHLGQGGFAFVDGTAMRSSWHVEMHQFRSEARPEVNGQPTPEGLHREGVDWVLVLLIRRTNVEGGVTTITDPSRRLLAEVTLSEPLDASLVDDRRVFHGVSGVTPLDPSCPAWRDVPVLTFRAEPDEARA